MDAAPPDPRTRVLPSAGRGVVSVAQRGGRSVVTRLYATSPLRFLTPGNHGRAAWIFSSSLGGGLVDGDHHFVNLAIGDGASAYVSTQASSKVYRSPRGTSADLDASVGDDAVLVVAPDPVVCFAGSRYRQLQQFDLAASASLVVLDWVTSGRRVAGERWEFDEYTSRTVVHLDGRVVLYDAVSLRSRDGSLSARFNRFDVLATIVLVGPAVNGHAGAIVSKVAARPIERRAEMLTAAAPLDQGGGCVVRMAGRSVEDVAGSIRELLDFVPAILGDDPWERKW